MDPASRNMTNTIKQENWKRIRSHPLRKSGQQKV